MTVIAQINEVLRIAGCDPLNESVFINSERKRRNTGDKGQKGKVHSGLVYMINTKLEDFVSIQEIYYDIEEDNSIKLTVFGRCYSENKGKVVDVVIALKNVPAKILAGQYPTVATQLAPKLSELLKNKANR